MVGTRFKTDQTEADHGKADLAKADLGGQPAARNARPNLLDRAIEGISYGPSILRRKPVFLACKSTYYRRYNPSPASGQVADIVGRLQHDGVVVLPSFFDADTIARINGEVRPDLDALADAGKLEGKPTYFVRDQGVARIMRCDTFFPATVAFYDHPMIWAIARSYVSRDVSSYLRMAEVRREIGAISTADYPHMDDWRMRFKAFLLLADVDEDHAPFVYYKGSHRGGNWRTDSEYEYFRDGNKGRFGHFFPHEWEAIRAANNIEKLVCKGPAGTLILTDTRGVHSGTPVRSGPRYLLGNYFNVRLDGQADRGPAS